MLTLFDGRTATARGARERGEGTTMAMSYEAVARRLGRQVSVQIDKRRGTEFRISPDSVRFKGTSDEADTYPDLQIRYRGIPVVTLHEDGTYTLRTGGMATKTVLRRISEYSPVALKVQHGTVYIHDPKSGSLRPFLEGMRVDTGGRMIDTAKPAPASTEDAIRRAIDARLQELGLSSPAPHPSIPNHSPGPTPAPVRAVRMRALVTPTGAPDTGADPAAVFEQAMRSAGLAEDDIARVIRDFRGAMYRGRDAAELPAQPATRPGAHAKRRQGAESHVPVLPCRDCKRPLSTHYDGANRFRGCEWAAKKSAKAR